MRLFQSKNGYRYNSDSLFLYDFFCTFTQVKSKEIILDLGCGCGILGLLLARDFDIELFSIDILEQNCKICYKNSIENNIKTNVICADFFEFAPATNVVFDKIICNPPFYDFGTQSKNLHKNTSKNAQNFNIYNFAFFSAKILKNFGELVFCYDARKLDYIMLALVQVNLKPIKLAFLHSKANKNAKLVLIVAKKFSKSPLEIVFSRNSCDENGKFLPWVNEIFKRADLQSIDI